MNGFDPNRVPTPQDPQEFGPYLVIGKLGQGGMGKVYLAVERAYDRRVALKITDPVADLSDEELRRFEAEAARREVLEQTLEAERARAAAPRESVPAAPELKLPPAAPEAQP